MPKRIEEGTKNARTIDPLIKYAFDYSLELFFNRWLDKEKRIMDPQYRIKYYVAMFYYKFFMLAKYFLLPEDMKYVMHIEGIRKISLEHPFDDEP